MASDHIDGSSLTTYLKENYPDFYRNVFHETTLTPEPSCHVLTPIGPTDGCAADVDDNSEWFDFYSDDNKNAFYCGKKPDTGAGNTNTSKQKAKQNSQTTAVVKKEPSATKKVSPATTTCSRKITPSLPVRTPPKIQTCSQKKLSPPSACWTSPITPSLPVSTPPKMQVCSQKKLSPPSASWTPPISRSCQEKLPPPTQTLLMLTSPSCSPKTPSPSAAAMSTAPSRACIKAAALKKLGNKVDCLLSKVKCDVMAAAEKMLDFQLDNDCLCQRAHTAGLKKEKQDFEWRVNELCETIHSNQEKVLKKDVAIASLAQDVQTQRDRTLLARAFYQTKAKFLEAKNREFMDSLASKSRLHKLVHTIFLMWHGRIKDRLKQKSEMPYREEVRSLCGQLCRDYAEQVKLLTNEMNQLSLDLERAEKEQVLYARYVKRAFMRGVCALNCETMSGLSFQEVQVNPLTARSGE